MDESLNHKPKMIIMPLKPIDDILDEYIILDDQDKTVFIDFKNYDIVKNYNEIDKMDIIKETDYDEYVMLDGINKNVRFSHVIESLDSKNERMFMINYKYFYRDIADSFLKTDIKRQFIVDITRCKYYINENIVLKPEYAINYYEWKFGDDLALKIMMLTTQALMGLPFQILQSSLFKDNLYLAEMKNKNDFKSHHYIFVTTKNDEIHIKTKKFLRIFKLEEGSDYDLYNVEIDIEVTINNENVNDVLIGYKFTDIYNRNVHKII